MFSSLDQEIIFWIISGVASVLSGVLIFIYAAEGMIISEGGIKGSFLTERVKIRLRFLILSIMFALLAIIGLPWTGYFPFVAVAVISVTTIVLYPAVWKTGIYHEVVRKQLEKHKDQHR